MPLSLSDENMNKLQRFVILRYEITSECTQVDQCRKLLFAKGRQLDRIPPTEAALRDHVKRAVYQAGYCWGKALVTQQQLPSPGDWGWEKALTIIGFLSGRLALKQVASESVVIVFVGMSCICFRIIANRGSNLSDKRKLV